MDVYPAVSRQVSGSSVPLSSPSAICLQGLAAHVLVEPPKSLSGRKLLNATQSSAAAYRRYVLVAECTTKSCAPNPLAGGGAGSAGGAGTGLSLHVLELLQTSKSKHA